MPSATDKLIDDLRNAPYAALDTNDVAKLIEKLDSNPAFITSVLESDACTHDVCGNYIKAEVIRKLALRVHNRKVSRA